MTIKTRSDLRAFNEALIDICPTDGDHVTYTIACFRKGFEICKGLNPLEADDLATVLVAELVRIGAVLPRRELVK